MEKIINIDEINRAAMEGGFRFLSSFRLWSGLLQALL